MRKGVERTRKVGVENVAVRVLMGATKGTGKRCEVMRATGKKVQVAMKLR